MLSPSVSLVVALFEKARAGDLLDSLDRSGYCSRGLQPQRGCHERWGRLPYLLVRQYQTVLHPIHCTILLASGPR